MTGECGLHYAAAMAHWIFAMPNLDTLRGAAPSSIGRPSDFVEQQRDGWREHLLAMEESRRQGGQPLDRQAGDLPLRKLRSHGAAWQCSQEGLSQDEGLEQVQGIRLDADPRVVETVRGGNAPEHLDDGARPTDECPALVLERGEWNLAPSSQVVFRIAENENRVLDESVHR